MTTAAIPTAGNVRNAPRADIPAPSPIAAGARAALQWRLLLLWAACLLLPTLLLAVPMWALLSAQLDYSVHAATLARQLDALALADLMSAVGRNDLAFGTAGIAALVLTLLLSPLLTGATVTAARSPARLRLRELAAGGLAEYPRMLRMLLWASIPFAMVGAAGARLMKAAAEHGRTVLLHDEAHRASLAAIVVTVLLVLLVNLTVDAGRATLAIDRRRTSAVKAWWRGLTLLRRQPGAVLAAYALLTVVGLGVAALLALGRLQLAPVGPVGVVAALLLTELIALVIGWMRMARLFALVRIAARER